MLAVIRRCSLLAALIVSAAHGAVLRPPADSFRFAPSRVAVADDGTKYVADATSETVQAYDADGRFLFSIDNEADTYRSSNSFTLPKTSLAVDGSGHLIVATTSRSETRVTKYTSGGEPVSESIVDRDSTHLSVAIDPSGLVYLSAGDAVFRLDEATLTPLFEPNVPLKAIDFDSEGRLFGLTTSAEVNAYGGGGALLGSFSVDQPLIRDESTTSFAIADDLVYVTDNRSGTARAYTRSGEAAGVGYAVPLTTDLAATPDGRLFAAMPDARVVERIGVERFEPDYSGVTRLRDRPPIIPDFYDNRLPPNGVDLSSGWTETVAPTFIVPGAPGEMTDLDFHFVANTAARTNVNFVYEVSQVDADPTHDPIGYFLQAIDAMVGFVASDQLPSCYRVGNPSLCDGIEDPTLLTSMSLAAGTEIGFLNHAGIWTSRIASDPFYFDLLINRVRSHLEDLDGVDDPAYLDLVTRTLEGRTMGALFLSSDPRANWGRMDQYVSFLGNDSTLIGVENLNLAGESDAEFTDFMFRISTRLIPTPEPAAAGLGIGGLALSLTAVRRLRRR